MTTLNENPNECIDGNGEMLIQSKLSIPLNFISNVLLFLMFVANRADPDQPAPAGAVWSGSALFAYWNMTDKSSMPLLPLTFDLSSMHTKVRNYLKNNHLSMEFG